MREPTKAKHWYFEYDLLTDYLWYKKRVNALFGLNHIVCMVVGYNRLMTRLVNNE